MKRRRLTAAEKATVWARQRFRCACGCGGKLTDGPVEYDHVLPLSLCGEDAIGNIEALLASCHRTKKTPADLRRLAKAKRQKRAHEEGRGRARKGRPLVSRGFDRTWRRRFDGTTERRV